jgi:GTPase SAR1 family protein
MITCLTLVPYLIKKHGNTKPSETEQHDAPFQEQERANNEPESNEVPGKPMWKPIVSKITTNSIVLSWGEPGSNSELVIGYTVFYHIASEDSVTNREQYSVVGNIRTAGIRGLKSNVAYVFKVRPEGRNGSGPESDLSEVTETKKSLADIVKEHSQKIGGESPEIYMPLTERRKSAKGQRNRFSRCEVTGISRPVGTPNERVLLLIGATGAGKSTLINGIVNYITDVCWNDDFRFKLIVDRESKSQSQSQTNQITAYSFHGFHLPYTLTVIDTPGFGDTRGIERDRTIVNQIKELFSAGKSDSIDQIHGIGFVSQASNPRLTPTQKYIFDSVLSIFGKDIASNIFLMLTFADGQDPPVLSAIKEAAIPYQKGFEFNNSALYASQTNLFTEMFWNLGKKNFQLFFTEFEKAEAHSLQLTRETLQERQQLEAIVDGLKTQIKIGITKIDELHQKQHILRKREADILQNEHFTYDQTVTKKRELELPSNVFVTNCLKCHFTCHYPCPIPKDQDKHRCKAMDGGGPDSARCTVCPGNCLWTQHVSASHWFEIYYEVETHTSDDLKKNFSEAIEGKHQVENMIASIQTELDMLQVAIIGKVRETKQSLERLQQIALKPNPLDEVEYIDLLINSEKSEKSPGFTERIKAFEIIKEMVKHHDGALDSETKIKDEWWKNLMSNNI